MQKNSLLLSLLATVAIQSVNAQLLFKPHNIKSWKETVEVPKQQLKYPTENPVSKLLQAEQAEANPNLVIDDGTRVFGSISLWSGGSFVGIAKFRPVDGTPVESVLKKTLPSNMVYDGEKYYGLSWSSGGGNIRNAKFYVYNTADWSLEKELSLPNEWTSISTNLAYNPSDKKIYAIAYDGLRRLFLATLDTETGLYNYLVNFNEDIYSMAFDSNGVLYAITKAGDLKTINLTTGVGTKVATISGASTSRVYYLTFDYRTDELYASYVNEDWTAGFNKINIQSGDVTKITSLPKYMYIGGLFFVNPKANDNAPNTVTGLNVQMGDNGSFNGKIIITAPSKTFGGSPLTGKLTLKISVDEALIETIETSAGETVSLDHTFANSGNHKVSVIASNSDGDSPSGSITIYAGYDTPSAVSNIQLAAEDSGNITLSWDSPKDGINGGYIAPEKITYTITRNPDNKVVAENLKENIFKEILPNTLARYSYSIKAVLDGLESESVTSNGIVFGDGMTPPFSEQRFGDDKFFNLCTVIDNDNDGNTFYPVYGSANAYVGRDVNHQADDWLITPPIYLEKGVYSYSVDFKSTSGVPAALRFTVGKHPDIKSQTQVLGDYKSFVYADGLLNMTIYVKVEESGKYYFGANFYSFGNENGLTYCSVQKFSLKQGPSLNAPKQVTNVTAEPFPKGELKNKIAFTTPSTDFNEIQLSDLTKIEITDHDGNVVATKSDVEPGKAYIVEVENAIQGINEYGIAAYNEEGGKGGETKISVYIGNDVPTTVTNLKYNVDDNSKITLTWQAPNEIGANGGYVNTKNVTYKVGRNKYASGTPIDVATGLTELSYTFDENELAPELISSQNLYLYGVTPTTDLGAGETSKIMVVLGKPYSAPFKESFSDGQLKSTYWGISLVKGSHAWNITSTDPSSNGILPYDSDNGMAIFHNSKGEETREAIMTPVFELSKMKNPVISFYMYHNQDATDDAELNVLISKDDADYVALDNKILLNDGTTGWKLHKISLSEYNDNNRLMIAFLAGNKDTNSAIAIDNVEIYDDVETDLALTAINAPTSININEGGILSVTVANKGRNEISSYELELYANGEKVDEVSTTDKLSVNTAATTEFHLQPYAPLGGQDVNYEVRINLASDANELNNTISTTVKVQPSTLPAPTNFTGKEAAGNIILNWNIPEAPQQTSISDSFEDYKAFAIDGVGTWKFIDKDGQLSNAINGIDFESAQTVKSFQVWNTADLDLNEDWQPHTGKQCLINFSASGYYPDRSKAEQAKSDDWMISPRVVGGSTVKFYASEGSTTYGNETFEFMVSYGSQNPDDFTAIGTVTIQGIGWQEYSFELPADARYFAIHSITEGGFALLIDDINYTSGYSDLELQGYNVYRDNVKINEELISTLSFSDSEASNNTVYGVSAVYDQGESAMTTWSKNAGIDKITGDNISAIGNDGYIQINNAANNIIRIFNAAGIKISEVKATDNNTRIHVQAGVYVVSIGANVFKVIVR